MSGYLPSSKPPISTKNSKKFSTEKKNFESRVGGRSISTDSKVVSENDDLIVFSQSFDKFEKSLIHKQG